MEIGQLVCVTWNDAHGSAANVVYSIDEIPHCPIEVTSYGVLLKQDDVGVSIASEKCDADCWRGYSFVPAKMIIKIEPVKKPRKSRLVPTPVKEST